jgi:hypothetical protein
VATGEDTRAARSAGKTAGSSGARIRIGSSKPRPPVAMRKAQRDPGGAPKNQDGRNIVACGSCLDGKTKQ